MANSLVIGLRILFAALGCVMVFTLTYTLSTDGLPFRKDLLTPWMVATLVDFYINVVPLAVWISYKESNWISATLWVILLACLGSITTCAYILLQFMKLSTQELQDPMYYVLLRHSNKYGMENKNKRSPVLIARVLFSALGLLMLGTLLYTLLTDGSPFRTELLTPWMTATLIDFYINVVALSVWVAYKESSWITAVLWIIFLICFGSITTCIYIVRQLLGLASQDPIYLVLLKGGSRLSLVHCLLVNLSPMEKTRSSLHSPTDGSLITILSIHGGEIREIIAGAILKFLDSELQKLDGKHVRLAHYFHVVARTSTGDLVAAMLTTPDENNHPLYAAEDIISFYLEHCPKVFPHCSR